MKKNKRKKEEEDYVSTTGAAQILGVSDGRIRNMIREFCPQCEGKGCTRCLDTGRRLPAKKIGRDWLIPLAALEIPDIRDRRRGKRS